MRPETASRVAALFRGRALGEYARWKIRTDPVYGAVIDLLRDRREPLFDVGCGVGLLPLSLRVEGITVPITGIDFDERKLAAAREAAAGVADLELRAGDARDPYPAGHNVTMLDVLQYFAPSDRSRILKRAREAVPAGGLLIIRSGIHDRSWRYRVTWTIDALGRLFRWMFAERLQYPTREEITAQLPGFDVEVTPCWGRTPYNNYLFVFRSADGTDREADDRR